MNTWEITFELAAACGCCPVLPSVMLDLNARPQSVQENSCSKETVVILNVETSQTPEVQGTQAVFSRHATT